MNDIFIFSMLKWNSSLLHRSHMLAKYFKKHGQNVFYVEKSNTINPIRWGKYKLISGDVSRLIIYGLPYLKGRFKVVFKLNDIFIKKALKKVLNEKEIKSAAALISTPHWSYAVDDIDEFNENVFYDVSDDYIAFAENDKWAEILSRYEKQAIEISKEVFITIDSLQEKVNNRGILIENGVDLDSFKNAEKIEFKTKGKVIGFIGGLYNWVDYELIVKITKANPDDLILIIGPTNAKNIMEMISKIDNVEYLGSIDKDKIHNYYASLDVGIIPFLPEDKYPRLKTVNSNKVYQYLFFDYPVVTTKFTQVEKISDVIYVSDSHEEFLKNIDIAKATGSKERKIDLKSISWETKAIEMMHVFEGRS
ncbi:MAG: glycosyltransferase [Bacillota bacterium]|nr:glycosyltransferase [Bacillota bacterium]